MQVNSESLAGTWPREVLEKVGEEELLRAASSEKNKNEHQIVSDYVHSKLCTLAGRSNVRVTDVKLLPMKHLVHIKQTYEAIVTNESSNSNSNLVSPTSSVSDKNFNSKELIPEESALVNETLYEINSPIDLKKQISCSPTLRTVSSSGSFAQSDSLSRESTERESSRGDSNGGELPMQGSSTTATTAASSRSGSIQRYKSLKMACRYYIA